METNLHNKVFDFMATKLGGENQVLQEYCLEQLTVDKNTTMGELIQKAAEQGWLDALKSIKVTALPQKKGKNNDNGENMPIRMTRTSIDQLRTTLLTTLTTDTWMSIKELSDITGVPPKRLATHLKKLRDEGLVFTTGKKVLMKYSLSSQQ